MLNSIFKITPIDSSVDWRGINKKALPLWEGFNNLNLLFGSIDIYRVAHHTF
jgi:hypothetical protein